MGRGVFGSIELVTAVHWLVLHLQRPQVFRYLRDQECLEFFFFLDHHFAEQGTRVTSD